LVRRLIAGLLTLLLAAGCIGVRPQRAAAAISEDEYLQAARMLNKYGLVQGDNRGYRVYAQITRAEMAKLVAYSLGQQSEAARRQGRGAFPDAMDHWADGVVAVVKGLGLMNGYPEGDFRPDNPVTYAEVVTVLSRMAGLEASSEEWPRTYVLPAQDAGIIPADMDLRAKLSDAAGRGDVFVMLWRTLTEVKNYDGQTLLRRYLDQTAPIITLDPLPESTGEAWLDVTGTVKDAVKVLVNGQPATVSEFGYFKGTATLRLGPNTIRVQAIDQAGNVKEVTVQVAHTENPAGAIALSGPATVAAAGTARFTMVIKDQNGETITDRSKVKAKVEPEDLGTFDPASGTFTAGTLLGSGQITVTSSGAMGIALITVTAGALERLTINPAEAVAEGQGTVQFTAMGYDKGGNEVPVTGVQWRTTGGTISQTGFFTAPAQAAKFTVTATDGGRTAQAMVVPPNYQVARVTLTQPNTKLRANGVSELTLTATLYDDKNTVVTDYTGTLTVSSSAAGVAEPVSEHVSVTNGVASVVVRSGSRPGAAVITVKTNLNKAATATVNVEAQKLQAIRLSGYPVPTTGTEPTAYVEAVAVDTDGNPMRSLLPEMVIVHLTLNSPTAYFLQNGQSEADIALSAVNAETGDVRTRTYIRYTPGTGTQVISGDIVSEEQDWIKVFPGAFAADQVGMPAKLRIEPPVDGVAGQPQTLYVNVLDADGYRVTISLPLNGIAVTLRDQNGVTWPTDPGAPGAGLGRIGFTVVQTTAGAYTYTATLQPAYATAAASATVVPGDAAQLKFDAVPPELVADSKSKTKLRAEVSDSYGNLVKAAYPVTFRRLTNTGALQAFPEQTVYTRNGVAELEVTAGPVIGRDDVEAVVLHPLVPNGRLAAPVRVVTRGAPDRLALSYGDNDADGTAGGPEDQVGRIGRPLTVYVDVLDRFGSVVASDSSRRITLTLRNQTSGQELPAMTASTSGGRATFTITRNDAATYALKAESGELMRALTVGYGGTAANVVIEPGGTLKLLAVADMTTLHSGGGVNYANVSVQLLDAQGNATPNQTGRPVAVTLSFPNDTNRFNWGYFTVDDDPNGTKTWTRTAVIDPGATESRPVRFFSGNTGTSRTIAAASLDGAASTVTVRSTTLGPIAKVEIEAIKPAPLQPWTLADGATDGQIVRVTARDSKGNRLSNYGGAITLKMHDQDARIVAVYQNGQPFSQDTGIAGVGKYPSEATAIADRGVATFVVRANTPGMKLYEVTSVPGLNLTPGQVTDAGRFDGEGPAEVRLELDRTSVAPNGTVTIKARVHDRFGAWLPALTGNVTFNTDDGRLPGVQVSLVGGVATVTYPAPAVVGSPDVQLIASFSGVSAVTEVIHVDDQPPRLTDLTITAGRVGVETGTANEGDTITFTFSEAISGASVLAALRPGITLTSGLGTIQFNGAGRIDFVGLPALGALDLTAGGTVGGNATFQVAAISLDASGTVVTVRLGARLTGTADPTVTSGGSAQWTTTGVKDPAGNTTPAAPTTVVGGF
jgi:hypothetical protein